MRCSPQMRSELADLSPRPPTIPIISTTYEDLDTRPVFDAEHWATNMRNPVRFQQAITAAGTDHHTFIEISAHPLLTQAVIDTLHSAQHTSKYVSIGTLQRDTDDTITFRTNLNTVRTTPPAHPPPTRTTPPDPHHPLAAHPPLDHHHARERGSAGASGPQLGCGERTTEIRARRRCARRLVLSAGLAGPPVHRAPTPQAAVPGSWWRTPDFPPNWSVPSVRNLGSTSSRRRRTRRTAIRTALLDALSGVDNVLYAPPVSGELLDVGAAYQVFHADTKAGRCDGREPFAAEVVHRDAQCSTRLRRRSSQPRACGAVGPGPHTGTGASRNLGRCHRSRRVDAPELAVRHVLDEAAGIDGEDQVVYRSGARHVPRLQRRAAPAASPVTLSDDTSQLVIGATGNIGPHLIRQLAEMGAKTIVTVSRNPGTRLAELAESLDASGTNLVQVAADATDPAAMNALFDRFGADLPPLEGIYLAAFAGQPVLLSEMTDDDVVAMFRPKLDAARLLHRLSLKHPVQHFVSFSSISGLIGSRWLAHYTATSAFLDTFGYARRLVGLPATVVAWGLWKSLADAQQDASQVSAESGLQPMADEVAIGALPLAMSPDAGVHSVVVAADWPLLAAAYRTRGALRIVDDLLPAPSDAPMPESEFRKALRKCQPERRHDMLLDEVGALGARVMGMPPTESLDPSTGFFQLGMDSLMSVTLQRALSESLGEFLPASVVFDYPTVYSLTDYLATVLPELIETADQKVADSYDDLTEDELLQQLSERLS